MNNFVALVIVVLYVVALFVFSFYAKKRQERIEKSKMASGDSYLLATRSLGPVLVCVTLMGVALGANGTVGIAQNGYIFGISAGWYDGGFAIGILVGAFLFIKKLRSLKLRSISEMYGDCYGGGTRKMASFAQIAINFFIMIGQYIGGGTILHALLPEYFSMTGGMIVSAIIFLAIALIGGMGSTAVTNIINIVILYVAVILAVGFTLSGVGGFSRLMENLPSPVHMEPVKGLGWGMLICYVLLFIFYIPTAQSSLQMVFAAKDDKSAVRGYFWGGILVLPFGFCTALIGIAAAIMFPELGVENSALALPSVIMTFPSVVAGIVLSGMWSANVSTATALIIANSSLFLNDLIQPARKEKLSGPKEVQVSRLITVAFTAVTLFCAFFVRFLLQFITMGLSMCFAFFLLMGATFYFPKVCKRSTAMVTLAASVVVVAMWMIFPIFSSFLPHVIYLQMIVCTLVFLATVLFDKRPALFRTPEKAAEFESRYGIKLS